MGDAAEQMEGLDALMNFGITDGEGEATPSAPDDGAPDPAAGEGGAAAASAPAADDEGEETVPGEGEGGEGKGEETPVLDPAIAALQAQNAALEARLNTFQQQPEAQASAPAAAPIPDYQFAIPQELVQMMGSEDPADRQRGMVTFAAGIAQSIHQQIRSEYEGAMQTYVQQQASSSQQANEVREDFYGKYPELNKPELYGLVQSVGQEVARRLGASNYSPELRDAIATQVKATLGTTAPRQVKSIPPKTPRAGKKGGGGGRPGAGSKSVGDQIVDLL